MKRNKTIERPNNGTYCMDCKSCNQCDWKKMHSTAISDKPCRDFEGGENNDKGRNYQTIINP